MHRFAGRLTALLLAAAAGAFGDPAGAEARVTASVSPTGAELSDAQIMQRWSISPEGVVTSAAVSDQVSARDWSSAGAPEFSLTLDSAPTSSLVGWRLIGASVRPLTGGGRAIAFRYGLAVRQGLVELDRTWSLYPGDGVERVSARLINRTPAVLRVGSYTLAELTSPAKASAEVRTYHGGSDWRQDFDVSTSEPSSFDDEGEVARFDDGRGEGWFLVGQRRSGAMSRVGRTSSGESWVGVENARDLFDYGPLMSSPPDYNRLTNPAYPAPVRERTVTALSTLDLGTAYLGVYHGGAAEAPARFVASFAAHDMPQGRQTVDLNSFHPWNHGPGLSDANLRPQAALFKQAGGEVFMLDDQWQGSSAGDWNWDTQRFPISGSGGVPAFVNYLHGLGLELGLWMAPAEFNPGSAAYTAHPDWACTPTGDVTAQIPDDSGLGVWDMTNPQVQAHLSSVIDRLIAQDGVREFKFDYVTWVDCPPHDYLDYEDAYVHWVQEQERAHPGVSFELDETNDQRLWPFRSAALGPSWFDNGHLQGSSYPSRLLHDVFSAAPWMPPSSLGFGLYDGDLQAPYSAGYLMPVALLGHVTFWTDMTKLGGADLAETAWWTSWYKAHRAALAGVVFNDTATDPIDGSSWAAFQPWQGNHGYLFAFSQSAGGTRSVALQGLDPQQSYSLADVRTGQPLGAFSASQLTRGIALKLAPYTALVLSVDPQG